QPDGGRKAAGRASSNPLRSALDVSGPSHRRVITVQVLAVLAFADFLAMEPWFSASAVAPVLSSLWRLDATSAGWLTISVQLGFVLGAIISAVLTLADRWSARRLVAGCAML